MIDVVAALPAPKHVADQIVGAAATEDANGVPGAQMLVERHRIEQQRVGSQRRPCGFLSCHLEGTAEMQHRPKAAQMRMKTLSAPRTVWPILRSASLIACSQDACSRTLASLLLISANSTLTICPQALAQ